MSSQVIYSSSPAERRAAGRAQVAPWVWLAGPYALVLFLFLAIPLCNLVVLSLFRYSATSIWTPELTASNYARILDGFYIALTLRSLWIGAITTALCVVLGYPLAYFLARCSPRALSLGLFLLVLPLMVSTVIRAFGWIILLGREGAINSLLRALGIGEPLGMLYSEGSVIVALVQYVLPLMVLPLMAAIERIPLSLEEAAVNLGSSAATVFRRLIFPLSLPGLVSGILLSFTVSISVVVTPALLGGRKVRMFGNEIYDQVVTANNWPFASSLAVMMILLTFLAIALGLAAGARAGRRR